MASTGILNTFYRKVGKRALDIVCSAAALVVLSPVYAATALTVRAKLGSPVIFSQERPGRIDPRTGQERIFKLYKFRSMTDKRDQDGALLPDSERLTPFGKTLRATSLDELPELWNILKGEMSLVGPRPLLVSYLPYYTPEERRRHEARPGLTGLAQVSGRNCISWDQKLQYDVQYVDEMSFAGDMKIILKTIGKVLRRADIRVGTDFKQGKFIDQRKARRREETRDASRECQASAH